MTSVPDRLSEVIAPIVADFGFDLESLQVKRPQQRTTVAIAIDSDNGVSIDDITEVSRAISQALDAQDPFGEQQYHLEVASRGATSPLTAPRHWRRNEGRLVKAKLGPGEAITGRIGPSDEFGVEIDGKRYAYDAISKAVIQLDFRRP